MPVTKELYNFSIHIRAVSYEMAEITSRAMQ